MDALLDYQIVLYKEANEKEIFAQNELNFFINKCFGKELPISNFFDINKKNIVIKTNNEFSDGYEISSDENFNYFITGKSLNGTVYAVYDFLGEIIGLNIFSVDCFTFNSGSTIKSIQKKVIPDIPIRSIGICPVYNGDILNPLLPNSLRMRTRGMSEGWGLSAHSYFKVLPKNEYVNINKDWFSTGDNGINLCLTNDDMKKEFVNRLKKIILENKEAEIFMLGQEDNQSFCQCERCKESVKRYNGRESAVMVKFSNDVVKDINSWVKGENINRKLTFCMFAYYKTFLPPVKKEGKSYSSILDFKVEDNLAVMIAPIGARCDISFFDKRNHVTLDKDYYSIKKANLIEVIDGWKKITKEMFFWSYCSDNYDAVPFYNCFDAFKNNYPMYKKYGVYYLFEEGTYAKYLPVFNNLKIYLTSNLMWNVNQNNKKLIKQFFDGYYGLKSSKIMYKYFKYLEKLSKNITIKYHRPMLVVKYDDFGDMNLPDYWSFNSLIKAEKLFNKALSIATDESRDRIFEEGFSVWYLLLINYSGRLEEEKKHCLAKNVIAIANKYSLFDGGEGIRVELLEKIRGMV